MATHTDRITNNKSELLKWLVGVITSVLIIATMALSSTIWGHETRITKVEADQNACKIQSQRIDRQLEVLNEKLDRLIERR